MNIWCLYSKFVNFHAEIIPQLLLYWLKKHTYSVPAVCNGLCFRGRVMLNSLTCCLSDQHTFTFQNKNTRVTSPFTIICLSRQPGLPCAAHHRHPWERCWGCCITDWGASCWWYFWICTVVCCRDIRLSLLSGSFKWLVPLLFATMFNLFF